MNRILFDTDVIIEVLRDNKPVITRFDEMLAGSFSLAVSPVSVAEIFQGMRSNERAKIEMTLGVMETLDINSTVGKRAGDYLRKYARSHGLEVPDAFIAATAAVYKYRLCTFNWKHYPMNDIDSYRIDR